MSRVDTLTIGRFRLTLITAARELARLKGDSGEAPRLPEDIRTLTGYRPRSLQQQLEEEARRFNVWVLHRRFGKTVACVNLLIEGAVNCPFPDGRFAYLGPTYSQTEDIAWHYLLQYTERVPGRRVELAKLAVWLPTYFGTWSRIRLYGVDSPKQRLRGMYMDGVVLDEFAQFPPSVWSEQVRPMLSDAERTGFDARGWRNQWAAFISTPMGKNQFYSLYRNACLWQAGEGVKMKDLETGEEMLEYRDDWAAALYKASETGVLTRTELRAARLDMETEAQYEQEYECSFEAAIRGAIYAEQLELMRQLGQVGPIPYNPHLPVHTGWDLGWDDSTALWFCQLYGRVARLIDYYENDHADLGHYADVLERKGYRYGRHYFPHDVEVHEVGTGKSRRSVLRELGIRVTTVPKHSPWDRIAACRRFLPGAYVDGSKCAEGLDHLAMYRREADDKMGTLRERPRHDSHSHAADSLGSLVMGIRLDQGRQDDDDPHRHTTAQF